MVAIVCDVQSEADLRPHVHPLPMQMLTNIISYANEYSKAMAIQLANLAPLSVIGQGF